MSAPVETSSVVIRTSLNTTAVDRLVKRCQTDLEMKFIAQDDTDGTLRLAYPGAAPKKAMYLQFIIALLRMFDNAPVFKGEVDPNLIESDLKQHVSGLFPTSKKIDALIFNPQVIAIIQARVNAVVDGSQMLMGGESSSFLFVVDIQDEASMKSLLESQVTTKLLTHYRLVLTSYWDHIVGKEGIRSPGKPDIVKVEDKEVSEIAKKLEFQHI